MSKIIIYYSVNKNEYAGWQFQVSQLLRHVNNRVIQYYKQDLWKFILSIIISKNKLIILPNIYGLNRFIWIVLILMRIKVIGRISGGELRFFVRNKYWLKRCLRNKSLWVLNEADFHTASGLGFIPLLIPNSYQRTIEVEYPKSCENRGIENVLLCGTITPRKGQLEVLVWLQRMKFKGCVHIVGPVRDVETKEDKYFGEIQNFVKLVDYEVIIHGRQRDVVPFYLNADVTILNSSLEGMPNVLIESIAYGVPCMSTDIPGSRDVLKDIGSELLYERNSFSGFKTSFDFINGPLYTDISKRSLEIYASKFSVKGVVKKFEECLGSF